MKRGLSCLVALLLPASAHAHGISPAIKGFYAGGMMVLNGPEDLLQWVALGTFAPPPAHEQRLLAGG
jgi:hydrogenase/urease accessory protein HupE